MKQVLTSSSERRPAWFAATIVALLSAGVFGGTLGHGFVGDDVPEVVDNQYVHGLANLRKLLTSASWEGAGVSESDAPIWRPLTSFSYALNHALAGPGPTGYHLANVLLHALVSLGLLWLGRAVGLTRAGALAAALWFSVMPAHVEAVANVAGRKELLVTLFTICAVLLHPAALRRGGAAMLLPAFCVMAALLSKESGLAVVAILAAQDLLLDGQMLRARRMRAAMLYAVYGLLVLAFFAARYQVLGVGGYPEPPFDVNPIASEPWTVRCMSAVAVLGLGFGLLVFPTGLSADYSFAALPAVRSPWSPEFLVVVAVAGALAWLAWRSRRHAPVGLFALAWYAVAIFPASNLLVSIGTIFGERLLYLPSVALALAAGALLERVESHGARKAFGLAGLAALVVYASQTRSYAAVWKEQLVLAEATVRAQPDSSRARRSLGTSLAEAGRLDEAAVQYEAAARILSNAPAGRRQWLEAKVELAITQERMGRAGEAERNYLEVLKEDSAQADALWRLGVLRWQQGRRPEATESWERAVRSNPRHAPALSDLGIAAYNAGNLEAAADFWLRSVTADPTFAGGWYRLGALFEQRGDLRGARRAWTRFLEVAPSSLTAERDEVSRKLHASGN